MTRTASDLTVDRLPQAGPSLEVVRLENADYGSDSEYGPRRPHRHDYHELIWTRSGSGQHLIDGVVSEVTPGAITLIGRNRVHVFERARGLSGVIVRFGDELLCGNGSLNADPAWLAANRAAHTVEVPEGHRERFEAAMLMLAAETERPPDSRSVDIERHLLSVLLLWIERWFESARIEQRDADDPQLQLYRRFVGLLERDFAHHGDAIYYADALAVPQAALSRSLSRVTGRTTKQLITDRRMLEAARLLRFTDLNVGEIAYRAGYEDQLYFSRAFKREHGEAPSAYRERMRGRGPERQVAPRTGATSS